MRQRFEFRAIVGLLIWIGLISCAIMFARHSVGKSPRATAQLARYIAKQRRVVELEFPPGEFLLKVGDPIFSADSSDMAPIGAVCRVGELDSKEKIAWVRNRAYATLFSNAPKIRPNDSLEFHNAPDTTSWAVQTMLPPEKRAELSELIFRAYQKHQVEIVASLKPVVAASLKEAAAVVQADLKVAFEARKDRIQRIGQRYQTDLIETEIVPLVQKEIWPIVQEEAQPLASEVGSEIWSEVSVFRFGWRYLYDQAPLTDRNLTSKEFNRFVDRKAVPILQNHIGEFVQLQQTILKRIFQNEKVKSTVSKSITAIVEDPEVQELLGEVFQEVLLNNQRLQEVISVQWNSPEARLAIERANRLLEPTITEIGVKLFGSPDSAIPPEFAMVLRRRILQKDSRWFVLRTAADADSKVDGSSDTNGAPVKKLAVKLAAEQTLIPFPSKAVPQREQPTAGTQN